MSTSNTNRLPLARTATLALLLVWPTASHLARAADGKPGPGRSPATSGSKAVQAALIVEHGRGLSLPSQEEIERQAQEMARVGATLLEMDRRARDGLQKSGVQAGFSPLPSPVDLDSLSTIRSFDWSQTIPMQVKDQGTCGSCWVFGAVGAFEANFFIRTGKRISASEQCLLDASPPGLDCSGGWPHAPFTLLMATGTANTQDYPYTGGKGQFRHGTARPYRALVWGFVGDGVNPTTLEIKRALRLHGPLAIAAHTSDSAWTTYSSNSAPVIKGQNRKPVDHIVTLVGWDDSRHAWRIKNSWGIAWGQNGFAWVDYESDMIGYFAVWIEAFPNGYTLPATVQEWLARLERAASSVGTPMVSVGQRTSGAAASRARAEADQARQIAALASQRLEAVAAKVAAAAKSGAGQAGSAATRQAEEERRKLEATKRQAEEAARRAEEEARRLAEEAARQGGAAVETVKEVLGSPPPPPPIPRKPW